MKDYDSFNKRNIFEFFTPKRVLFLSIDALDFKDDPRLKVRCCNYDENRDEGDRITGEVACYIPLGKFLVLAHDVLTGVAVKKKKVLAVSDKEGKYISYFEHYGGTKGPQVISTKLSLVNGLGIDAEFALLATSTQGKITSVGGIVPVPVAETDSDLPCKESIYINMPNDKLKEFCLIGKAYAEQYISLDLQNRLAAVREQRIAYQKITPNYFP